MPEISAWEMTGQILNALKESRFRPHWKTWDQKEDTDDRSVIEGVYRDGSKWRLTMERMD